MSDVFLTIGILLSGFAAGLGLGFIFFVGLWYTVRRVATSKRPGLVLTASALVRIGVTVVGFYFLAVTAGWRGVVAGLVGFIAARVAVTKAFANIERSGVGRVDGSSQAGDER